jgi:transcriptional regulator with XRE-family HTH domain
MARMSSRPKEVTVWYRGIPYSLDLVRCRRALVDSQVEGGLDSMESLANACNISRSTASRFFSGRPTSLAVTLKVLEVLKLKFEDIARPETEDGRDDQAGGTAGAGVTRQPHPNGGADGAARRPQGDERR